jgi:hypothetical protein
MRLLEYLRLSCNDDNINKFRMLNVGLCKKDTDYSNVINSIKEKYDIDTSMMEDLSTLNKNLRKYYNGDMKFNFCLNEDEVSIEKIGIKNRNSVYKNLIELNDKLSDIKLSLEKKAK